MTLGGAFLSQGGERPHLLGVKQNSGPAAESGGNAQSSAQSSGALTFSGQWQMNTNAANGTTNGIMEISQNGTEFVGRGKDQLGNGSSALCSYKGTLTKSGEIAMLKSYAIKDPHTGQTVLSPPINFVGRYNIAPGQPLSASGQWAAKRSVGHFTHRTMKEYGGTWFASRSPRMPYLVFKICRRPSPPPTFIAMGRPDAIPEIYGYGWSCSSFSHLCHRCLLFSVRPCWKTQHFGKEKYIPSQYKSQHGKMVSQFSKKLLAGGMPLGQRLEWRIWKFWEWGRKGLSLPPDVRKKIRTSW